MSTPCSRHESRRQFRGGQVLSESGRNVEIAPPQTLAGIVAGFSREELVWLFEYTTSPDPGGPSAQALSALGTAFNAALAERNNGVGQFHRA
ncbi:hypothetical protein BT69DRAFT_1288765 [Atractiella rhizophila]|nr:hypothetical protein BT69DRAFT_1288765 [Atractiella rhizophila]